MRGINKKGLIVTMLLLTLTTFTSCGSITSEDKDVPKLISNRKIDFMTETSFKKDIEDKFEVGGRIYSSETQKLAFSKMGILSYYNTYVGMEVKKGDILATMDIKDIEHKIAINKLEIEQEELKVALAKKSGSSYKIKEAEIALKIKNMELDKLNDFLENSTLVSDIDGVISNFISKDIGTIVSPNITLITVMDINKLGIRFVLNEKKLEQIKIGDSVKITRDDESFVSEIIQINDNKVIAKIPEGLDMGLKLSSLIKVEKVIKEVKDAILVPKVGIYTGADGISKVQVLDNEKIIIKTVKLGVELDEYYQILEGIKEGEEVIVK